MNPTLFSIGPLDFHSYTICMALAFLVGTLLAVRENYKLPKPYPITPAGGLVIFIFSLIGSKIYWNIQYGDLEDIWRVVLIWEGGLVFYGGLFGGIIGGIVYLRALKVPFIPMADIAMPFLPLAHGIARIGCFLNGCCWGRISHVPWAVEFPRRTGPWQDHYSDGLITASAHTSLPVHPTQLYATAGLFIIFFIMRYAYKRHVRVGSVALLYPFLYGIMRFTVENFRGDYGRPLYGMTVSQFVAFCLVIGSMLVYVVCISTIWRKPPAKQEAAAPADVPDSQTT